MAANAIDTEILSYLRILGPEEKKSILGVMKSFVSLKKENATQRVSIEQYNSEIANALKEVKAGKFTTQEDLEKEMAEW
jgi:hypothetical protein